MDGEFCSVWGNGNPGMGLYLYNGQKYKHKLVDTFYTDSSSIQENDIVIMTLDLTASNGTLSFKTGKSNDEGNERLIDHGLAFENIDVNKDYRMAVSM